MQILEIANTCFGSTSSSKKTAALIDDVVFYFEQLPFQQHAAHDFWDNWDKLGEIPIGRLRMAQCDMILKNTANAYDAEDSALKGSDFRLKLHARIKMWTNHAIHIMPGLDARHAATFDSYFNKLGIAPDERYRSFWQAKTFGLLDHATPQYISMIGMSQAGLGEVPELKFLKKWVRNVVLNRDKFSFRDSANILWTLAVWDRLSPQPYFAQLAHAFTAHIDDLIAKGETDMESKNLRQIRDATLWFGMHTSCPAPARTENCTSSLEQSALNEFAKAHMPVLNDAANEIRKLGKRTDMAVSTPHGQVNIEMDGHRHFIIDGEQRSTRLNGKTEFQSGLMCEVEPHLVLVRCPDRVFKEACSRFNGHCGEMMYDVFDQAARFAHDHIDRAFMLDIKGNSLQLKGLHA